MSGMLRPSNFEKADQAQSLLGSVLDVLRGSEDSAEATIVSILFVELFRSLFRRPVASLRTSETLIQLE